MAARAIWKARIRFGGVDVPVKLYSAVQDRAVHFRLLDAKRTEPVTQRMVDPDTGDVVEKDDIRRAFETDEGELVILDDEELDRAEPAPSREIEISRFVPPEEITHQWYDRPYWLGPDEDDEALDEREIQMAKQLVSAMESPFDIAAFHDEYRERVLELVEAKAAGKVVKFPEPPKRAPEASLADVLQASLAATGKERKRA